MKRFAETVLGTIFVMSFFVSLYLGVVVLHVAINGDI